MDGAVESIVGAPAERVCGTANAARIAVALGLDDTQMRSLVRDADRHTLHVRCGTDIRDKLKAAGLAGDFLEFSDPFCQGPLLYDNYLSTRAQFISRQYGLPLADATARLAGEYAALDEAAARYERIVMWFEHDTYDQLCLARLLSHFAKKLPCALELICIDRYPGIDSFRGLGQLSSDALATLWPGRRAVTAEQLHLGVAVWEALRAPSPLPLFEIAASGTPALPLMGRALIRHLQELPWRGDGLSLTQRRALQALTDSTQRTATLFRMVQNAPGELPFLGDLMFRAILRDMLHAKPKPLVIEAEGGHWLDDRLSLTDTGAALLTGERDFMALSPPERFVGGVRVAPGATVWRWDAGSAGPVNTN